jgi:pectate lyase/pectin methylesterase-like acyl-CoA thioesterase
VKLLLVLLIATVAQAQPRPQVSAEQAATMRITDYLAQGPAPWLPPAFDASTLKPDFIVAVDGSGTHRTVQAAVDAVPPNSTRRHVIRIQPGTYREKLCVAGKGPLTLLGTPGDPAAVRIVAGSWNAQRKKAGEPAHPCLPELMSETHGTPGSASVVFASDELIAAHLTIANDAMDAVKNGAGYPEGAGESGGAQAVALMTLADRVLLEQVQLLGHQDTLHTRQRVRGETARVYVRGSLIAGDVDFIFGNATLVIADSTILSRAGRRVPGNGGHVLAPSTLPGQRLGMLVTRTRFVAEPGVPEGSISLGRAWDEGVARGTWQAGVSPNGQALVRDSAIGPHIVPWSASTSRRPYAATGEQANRMAEFNNRDLPADPAREVLAAGDGWAAMEGGTRGGADALAADVFEVRNRAELAAALAGPSRPRIVKLRGRIDLSADDAGKPLTAEDFRDPAFSWEAYARAYDPATWGKRPPEGALEEARRRSARRQAERVVLRVPSNTTLIGIGRGAMVANGMLLLENVDNVIVRNIHFADAYDHFPAWDPNDNASGEWNSEYDNLSLRNARRVWVDHCSFDDGVRPDSAEPTLLGRRLQRHDGLLDITRTSNLVTVSWNHFRGHDKTTLVGSGDKAVADEGKLKVTFHHNLWEDVKERAPRVRYGQVHVFNNLHRVNSSASYGYSLGVGVRSQIYSERNAWETPPDVAAGRLVRWLKGSTFFDRESLHNGQPVDLLGALRTANPDVPLSADVGWRPPYAVQPDPATEVPARVRAGAGAGRLWSDVGH